MLWAQERRDSIRRVLPFIRMFQDSCARVVTSYTLMILVASPYGVGIWGCELYPEAYPSILSVASAVPMTNASQFFTCAAWLSDWQAQRGALGRRIKAWASRGSPQSPLSLRTAKSAPLTWVTVILILSCIFTIGPSIPQHRGAHSIPSLHLHHWMVHPQPSRVRAHCPPPPTPIIFVLSLQLSGFHIFLIPFQV